MSNKSVWKRAALAALLLVTLLIIAGCANNQDKVDQLPTDPVNVLPFETATATPSPAPTDQPGYEEWTGGDTTPSVTVPPTSIPTIAVITPSPTPVTLPTITPTPTNDSVLRNGSSGQAVRNLQQRLKDLGYYTGSVDGDFGAGTESALKEFQRVNGLTADGVAGSRTLSAINSSSAKSKPKATAKPTATKNNGAYATSRPTPNSYTPSTLSKYRYLQLGSSGSDVTRLQQRLKDLGYFKGTVNGKFGEDTEAAVLAFQRRNGQWPDGVAGEDTQTALFGSSALPAAAGSSNTVPTSGYRTLQEGEEGDDVKLLQAKLQELGYFEGALDGRFGSSTATAVKLFQQNNGLQADGVAGTGTQARLYSANAMYAPTTTVNTMAASTQTLESGSMGEDVYRLQERLYDLGYYTGRIDGIYSEELSAAVKAFQTANGLTADGKAGRNTQTKIYADAAKASSTVDNVLYPTLKQGDSGEAVLALQGLLATYGYYVGTATGEYDITTAISVQQLQAQNGLMVDGIAGPATQQLLYEGTPAQAAAAESNDTVPQANYATLKQGASGADVMMLQQFLQELGYYDGEQDGEFDAMTLLAVQHFQDVNGLTADGVAGSETLALLYSGMGLPSETLGVVYQEATKRDKLQEGDEGQDVFTMQERLYALGYLTAAPDGTYGNTTTLAVRAFQQRNELTVDGVAGATTLSTMYAAGVIPASGVPQELPVVSNRTRELEEQNMSGAIQGSLAGGGIAASHGSSVYYAGKGGTLYRDSGDSDKQIYNGPAKYIHASDKGVTFLSGNKILRVALGGGNAETLATGKSVKKLAVVGNTLYYQDGDALMRVNSKGETATVVTGIKDFTIDVFQQVAYTATSTGVKSIGLNGNAEELLTSTPADQVQICDSVVFFRSGGMIYRMQDGIAVSLSVANATWMGIYREKIYFVNAGILYRCDTDGNNNRVFYNGAAAEVSFVAGKVYIAGEKGGAVTQVLNADTE